MDVDIDTDMDNDVDTDRNRDTDINTETDNGYMGHYNQNRFLAFRLEKKRSCLMKTTGDEKSRGTVP